VSLTIFRLPAAAAGGTERGVILLKIASRGPRAVEERPLGAELLVLAGRTSGGLLTSDDLSSQRPEVHPASRHVLGAANTARGSRSGSQRSASSRDRNAKVSAEVESEARTRFVYELPWSNDEGGLPIAPAGLVEVATTRAVAAVDRFGAFAVACWDEGTSGLSIPELGLRAPFFATPVLRGETRVRPGDARPAAAPIALVGTDSGPEFAFAAFGASDAYEVLQGALRSVIEDDRIEAHGGARLVAVSHLAGVTSALR